MNKTKRIILDCTTLLQGGGVQVAISVFECLLHEKNNIDYRVYVPLEIYNLLPPIYTKDSRFVFLNKSSFFDKIYISLRLFEPSPYLFASIESLSTPKSLAIS